LVATKPTLPANVAVLNHPPSTAPPWTALLTAVAL